MFSLINSESENEIIHVTLSQPIRNKDLVDSMISGPDWSCTDNIWILDFE